VLLGFVLPVLWLGGMLWREAVANDVGLPLARFAEWAWASFRLAGVAALLATLLALALGFALRQRGSRLDALLALAARVLSLGYAVPGAVIAIGILLPVGVVRTPGCRRRRVRHRQRSA
jgi:iron(III) transport system permease protein